METCLECGRRIGRMRHGYGGFRRHMKSKGVLCPGSWQYPRRQLEALQQRRIEHQMHLTNGGLPASDSESKPAAIGR
jgi:hypothetical protein